METTDFYVLKLQFKAEDVETGEMKKQKREFLAECVNYAEAEKLAYDIMEDQGWMKHEFSKPEVVRITVKDLRTNSCITAEKESIGDFSEMYLEEEDDHFYKVDLSDPVEDENGKIKYVKISLFIPASTTGEAETYARKLFTTAFVNSTKIMNFKSAFVTENSLESIERNWQNM